MDELNPAMPPPSQIRQALERHDQELKPLWKKYKETRDVQSLIHIIVNIRDALSVALQQDDRAAIAIGRSNLALALITMNNHTDDSDIKDLSEAIELLRLCIPDYPADSLGHHLQLVKALRCMFAQNGSQEALKECIVARKHLLDTLIPHGHEKRVTVCSSQVKDLLCLDHGETSSLLQAQQLQREVISTQSTDSLESCDRICTLGQILTKLHATGEDVSLRELIDVLEAALEKYKSLSHLDHTAKELFPLRISLGFDLGALYYKSSDVRHLREGRELLTDSLRAGDHDKSDKIIIVLSLALWSHELYERDLNQADIVESVVLSREALALCQIGHELRESVLSHLIYVLLSLYGLRCDDGHFQAQYCQAARDRLAKTPLGSPTRAVTCLEASLAFLSEHIHAQVPDVNCVSDSIGLLLEANTLLAEDPALAKILVICFRQLMQHTSRMEVLEAVNTLYESFPKSDWYRAEAGLVVALSHEKRYKKTGNQSHLRKALSLSQALILLCPYDSIESRLCHIKCRGAVVDYLDTLYEASGELQLLREAIRSLREIQNIDRGICDSETSLYRLEDALKLLLCLSKYYQETGDNSTLVEVIQLSSDIVAELGLNDRHKRSTSNKVCRVLASSLVCRFKRTNEMDLLDEAIALHRKSLTDNFHDLRYKYIILQDLSFALTVKYECAGEITDIREVVAFSREIVEWNERDAERWSAYAYIRLADSIRRLYTHEGFQDPLLLREAVALQHKSLDLVASPHAFHFKALTGLVASLTLKYQQTGDKATWVELADATQKIMSFEAVTRGMRADALLYIPLSLVERYHRTGDADILDQAIQLQHEALQLHHSGSSGRSFTCAYLAASLIFKANNTDLEVDVDALLQEAITLTREALTFWAPYPNHPEHVKCRTRLEDCLHLLRQHNNDEVV